MVVFIQLRYVSSHKTKWHVNSKSDREDSLLLLLVFRLRGRSRRGAAEVVGLVPFPVRLETGRRYTGHTDLDYRGT